MANFVKVLDKTGAEQLVPTKAAALGVVQAAVGDLKYADDTSMTNASAAIRKEIADRIADVNAEELRADTEEKRLDAAKVERATFKTGMVVEQMDFSAAPNSVGVTVKKTNVNDDSQQIGTVNVKGVTGISTDLTFNMQTGLGELTIDAAGLKSTIESEAVYSAEKTDASGIATVSFKNKSGTKLNSITDLAPIQSPVFTGIPLVPNKTGVSANDGTLIATEQQVYQEQQDRIADVDAEESRADTEEKRINAFLVQSDKNTETTLGANTLLTNKAYVAEQIDAAVEGIKATAIFDVVETEAPSTNIKSLAFNNANGGTLVTIEDIPSATDGTHLGQTQITNLSALTSALVPTIQNAQDETGAAASTQFVWSAIRKEMLAAQKWKPVVDLVDTDGTKTGLPEITGDDTGYTWLCRVRQDTVTDPSNPKEDTWQWVPNSGITEHNGWAFYSDQTDLVNHDELDQTAKLLVSNVDKSVANGALKLVITEGLGSLISTYDVEGIAPIDSPTFTGTPLMPSKETLAEADGTKFASEWQVYNAGVKAAGWNTTNLEQLDIEMYNGTIFTIRPIDRLDIAQTISGVKTFSAEPVLDSTIAKPNKATDRSTFFATEQQVYGQDIASLTWDATDNSKLKVTNNYGDVDELNDFDRLSAAQSISGLKTFLTEPVLDSTAAKTTAAENDGTKFATEWQVYNSGIKSIAWDTANDTAVITMTNGDELKLSDIDRLTQAQTISGLKTFTTEPVLPSKSTAATASPTKPATEQQVFDATMDDFDWETESNHTLCIKLANGNHDDVTDVARLNIENTFADQVVVTGALTAKNTFTAEKDVVLGGVTTDTITVNGITTFLAEPKLDSTIQKTTAAENDGTKFATEQQVYTNAESISQIVNTTIPAVEATIPTDIEKTDASGIATITFKNSAGTALDSVTNLMPSQSPAFTGTMSGVNATLSNALLVEGGAEVELTLDVGGQASFKAAVDMTNGGQLSANVSIDEGTWDQV